MLGLMLSLGEGVQVAIVSSSAVVAVAVLGLVPSLLSRSQAKRGADAIGTPNGHGTVVQMLGEVLTKQQIAEAKSDERHGSTDARLNNIELSMRALDARVTNLEKPVQTVIPINPSQVA